LKEGEEGDVRCLPIMSATLTLYDLARFCRYVTMVARPRFSLRPSSSAVAREPSQPLFAPREASHAVVLCEYINRGGTRR
jgi:hypothetical protein